MWSISTKVMFSFSSSFGMIFRVWKWHRKSQNLIGFLHITCCVSAARACWKLVTPSITSIHLWILILFWNNLLVRYEMYLPLHDLWTGYMQEMLNLTSERYLFSKQFKCSVPIPVSFGDMQHIFFLFFG